VTDLELGAFAFIDLPNGFVLGQFSGNDGLSNRWAARVYLLSNLREARALSGPACLST